MTLKIGLIGCGGITQAHVEGWKKVTDQAEIVAVADVSRENAEKRAAQIGTDPEIVSDYKHFVDAIEGGYEPLHSVDEATTTLQIILGAYQSVEENRIISLA
ncbi:MAG: Gfo/Idh/MocA family oxidoreductase [Caldilineaceae bacterium]|nr:Gfo/Idh/MocA family oxidoreductase [Caldilineaceae bacterium]